MAVVAVGFELPVWARPFHGIDSVILVKGITLNTALYSGSTDAVITIRNSTLIRTDNWYVICCDGGTVSLEGAVNLSGEIYGNVTVLPGTYNFDPTSYVDADTYTVNYNDYDDTWTVTAK